MKHILLILCILYSGIFKNVNAEDSLNLQVQSAYLIESESGLVLYEKNAEEKLFPASMTKMMGLLLIFESINHSKLSLQDPVTISETAASMGGSQVYLETGEIMSVEDLLKSICISSANDAMVAMAEKVSGSVINFVGMMNDKAKQLNLTNTHFVNTTGLHDPNHYSCAKDMAIIGKALIKEGKDQLLELTSTYDAYIREDTNNPFWLVNTNKMIRSIDGVDGLKTGFTQEAKSCITVTAIRNDIRLIGVVMKASDSKIRNQEASKLLDYGFSLIEKQSFFNKNDIFMTYEYEYGKPRYSNLIYLEDVSAIIFKNDTTHIKEIKHMIYQDKPPYHAYEKIGYATFILDNDLELEIDIGLDKTIQIFTFKDMILHSFTKLLT